MNIGILGAGAMGSLYGGVLSSNNDVYLIDIWKEHVDKINNDGLTIVEQDNEKQFYPKATTDSNTLPQLDIVIVFVKSIHTLSAIKQNQNIIGDNTIILSLQNGYGNIEDIEKVAKKENIIAGTTSHGATLLSPGKIRHAGVGKTYIGALDKNSKEKVELVKNVMNNCNIETEISENILELIWSKLIVNVAINPLTALLKVENGKLLESNNTKELMNDLIYEAIDVAKELGIKFDLEQTIEHVRNVAKNTYNNKSSMLQDVLNKRETEIDKINGAVLREGTKLGVNTPINSILVKLIKSINDLK